MRLCPPLEGSKFKMNQTGSQECQLILWVTEKPTERVDHGREHGRIPRQPWASMESVSVGRIGLGGGVAPSELGDDFTSDDDDLHLLVKSLPRLSYYLSPSRRHDPLCPLHTAALFLSIANHTPASGKSDLPYHARYVPRFIRHVCQQLCAH